MTKSTHDSPNLMNSTSTRRFTINSEIRLNKKDSWSFGESLSNALLLIAIGVIFTSIVTNCRWIANTFNITIVSIVMK
ncbi:hypothetical protein K2173_001524 [Erythroxylum novogranatense]|uniref:Uncharacterized protein n=1 Tax=Erythroxylum novogranatense TaxID=1862640 RepID=A0AAV8T5D0_9ROSI|nr:hypothetical protein K2173_001524 [Erythroxylum novogranatense]